jgi:hypothetical protein
MARSPHQLRNEDRLVAPGNQALLSLEYFSTDEKGGGGAEGGEERNKDKLLSY